MTQSPFLAAYLAATQPEERGLLPPDLAARPKGPVIWAVCAGENAQDAVHTLTRRLVEDGENVKIIATTSHPEDASNPMTPNTRRATRVFLDHWQPWLVVWIGGPVDPAVLFELGQQNTPAIMVAATSASIQQSIGHRVPGMMRQSLRHFREILTLDKTAAARLIKAGAAPETTRAIGPLEDAGTPPPCDDAVRVMLTQQLSTRPLWFAADLPLAETEIIAQAYLYAARRAHRTLLILAPRHAAQATDMANILRHEGLSVACKHDGEDPKESTQIYLVATDDGAGLWCRLSSITYLGGSLSDAQTIDPFIPALLGSAIISGPQVGQQTTHFKRLSAADAVKHVATPDDLGPAIEDLLATDLAARQAHAAWDVTSRGADATDDFMTVIYTYLDRVDTNARA